MTTETFDFQGYIAEQKDPEARARSLAVGDYAYRGDVKWLRTLQGLVPVRVMMSATNRLWTGWGRKAILADATKATEKDAPRVYEVAREASKALHVAPTQLWVTPHLKDVSAQALGAEGDEVFVAVHTEAIRALDDAALSFVIGRQLGHVQNGHVRYITAWFYNEEIAGNVVKWAIRPALLALTRWQRLATITADRAGLLACRDLEVARRQIVRESLNAQRMREDVDLEEVMAGLDASKEDVGVLERLLDRHPSLGVRLAALQAFTETRYYRDHIGDSEPGGTTLSEVDGIVADLLSAGLGSRTEESE